MIRLVELLDETWASALTLGASLDESDWTLPTGCPGWTVFDQFAHLAGFEAGLTSRAEPPHVLAPALAAGKDDFGVMVETQIDRRRGLAPAAVLAELGALATERAAFYRAAAAQGEETEVPGVGGLQPLRRALPVRLADVWIHEQDIRRAIGRPGHDDGAAAETVIGQLLGGLRGVLPRVPGLVEGSVVVLSVHGPAGSSVSYQLSDGRARAAEAGASPAVTLRFPPDQFVALAAGRSDAAPTSVAVSGDAALGEAILARMTITP